MSTDLLYYDLSYQVLGCAFAVYKELGPFFREPVYQRAMEVALSQAGLSYERQKSVVASFRGNIVGRGLVDLVVENKIVLELKAVESLHPVFVSQVVQYLAATGYELGFILNFGSLGKLAYKRVILSRKRA